ncbi:MAG: hypothetical protein ACLFST_04320 [Spirochaetia bacterium]
MGRELDGPEIHQVQDQRYGTHGRHEKTFIPPVFLKAGDTVEITYPIRWDTHEEEIGGRVFALEWLGSTCVGISPPGLICPLYNRQYLKREPYPGTRQSFPYPEKEFTI